MGTNYYAHKVDPTPRKSEQVVHIGKSSSGWLFLFHDCEQFHTYPQLTLWLRENVTLTKRYILKDEYDRIVEVEDFIEMIQEKQNSRICRNNPDNFKYCKNIDGYRFQDRDFL